ncbi:MAG: DUF5996 family protein [Ardenticatenaceae bacterium]
MTTSVPPDHDDLWPPLPLAEWQDTCTTLHMWSQVVGKIRLEQSPMLNHWWQVPLYVTARGLTTSPIPYHNRTFEIEFDFIDHHLYIRTSDGAHDTLALAPRSVADFYQELMTKLHHLGIEVRLWTMPVEVPDPIPFDEDDVHASYDADYAHRFWRVLALTDRIFQAFRSRFIGKSSPVHFFWGSFDMALTFFSGRRAPEHPGAPNVADFVTREAYSHEVSSCGWWPGGGAIQAPAFYAYAYPAPPGYPDAPVRPDQAFYSADMGEFILLYDDARHSDDPEQAVMEFLQSTYEAAANLAHWDRAALERPP